MFLDSASTIKSHLALVFQNQIETLQHAPASYLEQPQHILIANTVRLIDLHFTRCFNTLLASKPQGSAFAFEVVHLAARSIQSDVLGLVKFNSNY